MAGAGRASDAGHQLFTIEKAAPGRLIDGAIAAILAYSAIAGAEPAEPEIEPMIAFR